MSPAVGPRATVPTDDAAFVALKGASLAFQKQASPYSASNPQLQQSPSTSTPSPSPGRAIASRKTNSLSLLHSQQYNLEHLIKNRAFLPTTSPVDKAQSPAAAEELTLSPFSRLHPHSSFAESLDATTASDVASSEVESDTGLSAALVAAQQLSLAPTTMLTAPNPQTTTSIVNSTASDMAAKLDTKNPSLIAATLAANRSISPASTPARKPQQVDVVDFKSIPPTNSLIFIFEQDTTPDKRQRQTNTTSPQPLLTRNNTRSSPINIKQTIAAPTEAPMSTIKQKASKPHHSTGRLWSTPQTTDRKMQSGSPRRRSIPCAAIDHNLVSAPTTIAENHSSTPKSIAKAAKNKPRKTPPKIRKTNDALETEDQPRVTEAPVVNSGAKPSPMMRITEPKREPSSARRHTKQRSLVVPSRSSNSADHSVSQDDPVTPRQEPPSSQVIRRSRPQVLSPKPRRVTRAASIRSGSPSPSNITRRPSSTEHSSPAPPDSNNRQMTKRRPPTPPKPRNSRRLSLAATSQARSRSRRNSDMLASRPAPVNSMWGLPIVSSTTANTLKLQTTSPAPLTSRESSASAPPSPTHEPVRRGRSHQSSSHHMHLSSMTDAIMASSLASARLTPYNTGSSLPLPPPSQSPLTMRQRSPHLLLQTLRPALDEPNEDANRHKRNHHRHRLYNSNKHRHDEGSRRRWRDTLTDRERKRYEALWASNRGLLLTTTTTNKSSAQAHDHGGSGGSGGLAGIQQQQQLSDCVVNVVVRDIWKRSRLPADELAEVWDLVDRGHAGYLTRPEFAVGMFLIDQRLRGRKLPPKVSDDIWGSVNSVTVSEPKPRSNTRSKTKTRY